MKLTASLRFQPRPGIDVYVNYQTRASERGDFTNQGKNGGGQEEAGGGGLLNGGLGSRGRYHAQQGEQAQPAVEVV